MSPAPHSRDPHDGGITLLELVIVLSLFALVAVMGLQALSGMMRADERLSQVDARSARMSRALTLLRNDLKAADSRVFWPPGAGDPERAFIDLSAESGVLEFTISGQPVLPDIQTAGFSRVIWRHDREGNRLTRQVWPVLRPGEDRALAPEVEMLSDIIGLSVLSYADADASAVAGADAGWVAQYGTDEPGFSGGLPQAVDVRLISDIYGPLRVVVRF